MLSRMRFRIPTPMREKHVHTWTCVPCPITFLVQIGLYLSYLNRLIRWLERCQKLWNMESLLKTTYAHLLSSQYRLERAHSILLLSCFKVINGWKPADFIELATDDVFREFFIHQLIFEIVGDLGFTSFAYCVSNEFV